MEDTNPGNADWPSRGEYIDISVYFCLSNSNIMILLRVIIQTDISLEKTEHRVVERLSADEAEKLPGKR